MQVQYSNSAPLLLRLVILIARVERLPQERPKHQRRQQARKTLAKTNIRAQMSSNQSLWRTGETTSLEATSFCKHAGAVVLQENPAAIGIHAFNSDAFVDPPATTLVVTGTISIHASHSNQRHCHSNHAGSLRQTS